MLLAQLEDAAPIAEQRSHITRAYYDLFTPFKTAGCLRLPVVPPQAVINHHAFFVIFDTAANRDRFLQFTGRKEIYPYSGYLPLHSSKMGMKFGYKPEDDSLTHFANKVGEILGILPQ